MGQVQFGSSIQKKNLFIFFFWKIKAEHIEFFWGRAGWGEIYIAPGMYKGDCYYYAEAKGEVK